MTRDDLVAALTHDNVSAFLRVLREGESSQDDDTAFHIIVGGQRFDSFDQHPHIFVPQPNGTQSSAAGAFQITWTTWTDYIRAYGPRPFTPEEQALCAVFLINRAGALDDVIAGRLDAAIRKLTKVWTSLAIPKRQKEAPEIFAAYGGRLADSQVPQPIDSPAPQTTVAPQGKPMGIFAALLPTILQSLPQLISVFGSPNDSEVAKRNQAAGVVVADTLIKATQAVNLQDAVEKIQNDPSALDAAHAAVNALIPQLVETGSGGIGGAREAMKITDGDWRKLVFSLPFVGMVAIMPLVWAIVAASVFKAGWLVEVDDQLRGVVWGFVIGTGFGSIIGFIYGTTNDSSKKTAALIAK